MKILLVDDDEGVRKTYKDKLEENEEWSVEDVGIGSKALARIKANKKSPYDFILIDYVLKEQNGIQLIQDIRKLNTSSHIILFTNKDEGFDEDNYYSAIEAGATTCEIKEEPGKTIDLINTVKHETTIIEILKRELTEFQNERKWLKDTLNDTKAELTVIDHNFRILYLDEKKKNGLSRKYNEKALCYTLLNDFKTGVKPCKHCVVKQVFDKKADKAESLYFSIKKGTPHYYRIYAVPLKDGEEIIKDSKGDILVAIESAVDLDVESISRIPPRKRIESILKALEEEYEFVSIFIPTGQDNIHTRLFIMNEELSESEYSSLHDPFLQESLSFFECKIWEKERLNPVKRSEMEQLFKYNTDITRRIDWPLVQKDQLLGILSLGSTKRKQSNLDILYPFIDELKTILLIEDKVQDKKELKNFNIDTVAARVYTARTPYEALSIIIEEAKKIPGVFKVHIRIVKGSNLQLWPGLWQEMPITLRDITLRNLNHYECQAADKKDIIQIPDTRNDERFKKIEKLFPDKYKPFYNQIRSLISYPIVKENNILGTVSFLFEYKNYSGIEIEKIPIPKIVSKTRVLLSEYHTWEIKLGIETKKADFRLSLLKKDLLSQDHQTYMNEAVYGLKNILEADICTLLLWDKEWGGELKLEACSIREKWGRNNQLKGKYVYTYKSYKDLIWRTFHSMESFNGLWQTPLSSERNHFYKFYKYYLDTSPGYLFLHPISRQDRESDDYAYSDSRDFYEKKPGYGIIEIIRKDRAFKKEEAEFIAEIGSLIGLWLSNYNSKQDLNRIQKMQRLLLDINQYIPLSHKREELYWLFLLIITHNQGLGFNRAFLVLPDTWDGNRLKVVAAIGPKDLIEKDLQWKRDI